MKDDLAVRLLTIEDLTARWSMSPKTCYRIAAQYKEILDPKKIGREYRFEPENVKRFEEQMRMVTEDKEA